MDRKLEDTLREAARAEADSKKKKKKADKKKEVLYDEKGNRVKEKMKGWKKGLIGTACTVLVLAGIIYIPPYFYSPSGATDAYTPIMPDPSALKTYQQFVKDSPDLDFDQDGLTNAEENGHGTDIWNVDTDNDGVYDSAELAVTNTSPTSASSIQVDMVKAEDEANGSTIATPYKIDDIIFWPDDYTSKAYGAVVRTINGYRFWNFHGYVKFPSRVYAYEYVNGVHRPLPYREAEDAYRIDSHNEVRIYQEELVFTNELRIPFAGSIYLDDSGFGSFLSSILPDEGGPLTCQHKAIRDTEPDTGKDVTVALELPSMDFSDLSRFSQNHNTLKDLSGVYKQVEAGYCVAASIYSGTTGETIAIIYGHDQDGNLLVADASLKPVGKLTITECAKRVMNKEGVIGQMSWYEFSGLGFNSYLYKDRINFFASTVTAVKEKEPEELPQETEEVAGEETEPVTEPATEAATEPAAQEPVETMTEAVTEAVTEAASMQGLALGEEGTLPDTGGLTGTDVSGTGTENGNNVDMSNAGTDTAGTEAPAGNGSSPLVTFSLE